MIQEQRNHRTMAPSCGGVPRGEEDLHGSGPRVVGPAESACIDCGSGRGSHLPDPSFIPLLREEVNRLPEDFRMARLVLCYLEGKTNQEAAARLRLPLIGTIKGRLSRARQTLRGRLSRRPAWNADSRGSWGRPLEDDRRPRPPAADPGILSVPPLLERLLLNREYAIMDVEDSCNRSSRSGAGWIRRGHDLRDFLSVSSGNLVTLQGDASSSTTQASRSPTVSSGSRCHRSMITLPPRSQAGFRPGRPMPASGHVPRLQEMLETRCHAVGIASGPRGNLSTWVVLSDRTPDGHYMRGRSLSSRSSRAHDGRPSGWRGRPTRPGSAPGAAMAPRGPASVAH